jgi:hypothetical protein
MEALRDIDTAPKTLEEFFRKIGKKGAVKPALGDKDE